MTFAGVSLIWPWCPCLERCILKDHKPHSPLHQGETWCAWRSRLIRQSIQAKWKFLKWHPTCVNTHTFVWHSLLDKQVFKKQSNICHCVQNMICHTGGRRDYYYSLHYWDEWVFFFSFYKYIQNKYVPKRYNQIPCTFTLPTPVYLQVYHRKNKQAWWFVQCSEMQVLLAKLQSFLLKMRPEIHISNGAKGYIDHTEFQVYTLFHLSVGRKTQVQCQICMRPKSMQMIMRPNRLYASNST